MQTEDENPITTGYREGLEGKDQSPHDWGDRPELQILYEIGWEKGAELRAVKGILEKFGSRGILPALYKELHRRSFDGIGSNPEWDGRIAGEILKIIDKESFLF